MNIKRLLLIFLILVAAVASLSIVSADNSVKVGGIDFNIPDGFSEDKAYAKDGIKVLYADQFHTNGYMKEFDNGGSNIGIRVMEFNSTDEVKKVYEFDKDRIGGTKSINGKDGVYGETGDGFASFSFCKDKKYVIVSTNDESLFEKVIPK